MNSIFLHRTFPHKAMEINRLPLSMDGLNQAHTLCATSAARVGHVVRDSLPNEATADEVMAWVSIQIETGEGTKIW